MISLLPNESYDGPRKPQNGGVDFVSYATAEAAYTDLLSDNLDVINPGVPPTALATYKDDLGGPRRRPAGRDLGRPDHPGTPRPLRQRRRGQPASSGHLLRDLTANRSPT